MAFRNLRFSNRNHICDFLPKPKVKASQFPVHISYFLQKCKNGKPSEKSLPFLENDITGSEATFKTLNT
jgi:hypothetical protein